MQTRRLSEEDGSKSDSEVWDHIFSTQEVHADKKEWMGWCEIESEPAFFNMMLEQFGVKGVKVYEVFSIDEDMLRSLPQPVYGLIFLSKFQGTTSTQLLGKIEDAQGIWFANQTVDNACATLALLNIINNVPGLELGEQLTQFRDFTESFSPELRGEAVGSFEFVRQVHNSFARKLDMLNSDLCMSNEAQSKRNGKTKTAKSKRNAEEVSYHFNAFMPIKNELWRLDGLERHPQNLGSVSETTWLPRVITDLARQIACYEANTVEFAVLGIVQDPLPGLVLQVAKNIKRLQQLDATLDVKCSIWREAFVQKDFGAGRDHTLLGADEGYGVREEDLAKADLSEYKKETTAAPDDLLMTRIGLVDEQAKLRNSISQEKESNLSDEAKCQGRKFDYGPVLFEWLKAHVSNGTLREVVDTI